jgi:mono/diheme cytochrome c family protein
MQHAEMAAVDTVGLRRLPVPAEFHRGAERFRASCASCHGEAALGSDQRPPLVHMIYEPNHHAGFSFVMAAERGVRAHHWSFGDMPPRPEVSREEVMEIVAYVRWLQREAGVY